MQAQNPVFSVWVPSGKALQKECSPRNSRPGRWQLRETQIFQVPPSSDSQLQQCPFIIFYFTLIPLSQLHSQTPQSYPVLFPDTIPFTIAGSPSGNIHRVLLCFHPQRTKHALSAQDDLFQTKEKQQHERIKAESPGERAVCASPPKQG